MSAGPPLPRLPLARLACSSSDFVRGLVARQPAWAHASPGETTAEGERGVSCYRLQPHSFFLQVHWRLADGRWSEREVVVVPGTVVALRLVLDDVDPAAITRLLDLPPTRAFAKGSTGPHGRRFRDEGLWIHEVLPNGWCFPEEKVAELLAVLRARPRWRDVAALPAVTWAGVTVQLHGCPERAAGFALDTRLLEDLVGLSLQLDLELVVD